MATPESMVGELLVKASHVILHARTQGNVARSPKAEGPVTKSWVRLRLVQPRVIICDKAQSGILALSLPSFHLIH